MLSTPLVFSRPPPLTSLPINHQVCGFYLLTSPKSSALPPLQAIIRSLSSTAINFNTHLSPAQSNTPSNLFFTNQPKSLLNANLISTCLEAFSSPPKPWHFPTLLSSYSSGLHSDSGHTAPVFTPVIWLSFVSSPSNTPVCLEHAYLSPLLGQGPAPLTRPTVPTKMTCHRRIPLCSPLGQLEDKQFHVHSCIQRLGQDSTQ